jgi:acyl-CoA oxidase
MAIGLASELLLGRYQLPAARYPDSLLAKHELGVFKYLRDLLAELGGKHRSEEFNQRVLPQSLRLAEAIGSRMAYEAAKDAGIDPLVLQLFEAGSVNQDLAWYTEAGLLTQKQALDAEAATLTALFPHLDQLLEHTGAEPYAYAAIGSEDKWEEFVRSLPVLRGDAYVDLLDPVNSKQARSKL